MLNKLLQYYRTKKYLRVSGQMFLLILFVTGLHYWQSRNMVHGPAPRIIDRLLTGEAFDLAAQPGEVTYIYFWAPWCPVCKLQDSSIDAIARDYRVITIASWADNKKEVIEYMGQRKLDFPVIVDEQGEWAALYGVKAVPAGFYMDRNADIRFTVSGYTSEMAMRLRLWWLEK